MDRAIRGAGRGRDGNVRKIFVVPKPYQRPHPPLFQAFSVSDETIVWCAKQGIIPMTLITHPDAMARVAKLFQNESAKAGRKLELGQRIGVLRQIYFGQNKEETYRLAEMGTAGVGFGKFWGHFGFFEAFRLPGDEEKWPRGKALVPQSEWTVDRMDRAHYLFMGSSPTSGARWTRWWRRPIRNTSAGTSTRG